MTREEINILQDIVDIYEKEDMYPLLRDKEIRTIKLAIKELEQEPCEVSEYDKDHIWYKGHQYISLRRFAELKSEEYKLKAEAYKEPCEDAVSREAFIKRFDEWMYSEYGRHSEKDTLAIRVVKSLPPVQPKAKRGDMNEIDICGRSD